MTRPTLGDRLAGAVWGHLVGDALGVPYEFREPDEIRRVRWGEARGSHSQPPGTWSDDGALMLALLDSLLDVGFDTTDQARRALAWYRDGAYTPDRDGRFDVGGATSAALDAFASGTPAEESGPAGERSGGNGSLMRILPLALVERHLAAAKLVDHAHRASRVTHGHPRPQVACALYVLVARQLLRGVQRADALADARTELRGLYVSGRFAPEYLDVLDHLEGWSERAGRGSAWDAFWSAWDSFAGARSYREAVERAVRYGHDTDTTAAICGGLAGIHWGIDGIPSEWLASMRGKDVVRPLIARLLAGAGYKTDELRVDWVDLTSVPALAAASGAIGMTFLPGKKYPGGAGDHWRDLEGDAVALAAIHLADTLLVLVEDDELQRAKVRELATVMGQSGIELLRHPIVDAGVPADRAAFAEVLQDLRRRVEQGGRVVVACMGGLGRTGTTVASLLVEAGLEPRTAIELTRRTRPGTIENEVQERFVLDRASR